MWHFRTYTVKGNIALAAESYLKAYSLHEEMAENGGIPKTWIAVEEVTTND